MMEFKNVTKTFGDFTAVDNINLNIKNGEFLTLLGPSGCGKTTSLRMIAGFEHASEGQVMINGEDVCKVEPYHREVNTVFQSYALFPHMNIFDNVAFGLKIKKVNKDEIKTRVEEVLNLVQLKGYGKRSVKQLSGGQQQRVAIARAIVNNPKILLLDEPLGALDLKLRKQMQLELKNLQKSLGITFIYVTHDQEEALTMSDRIVVMNKGKIEQIGTPYEIYERPTSEFVADFIGETNIVEGKVISNQGGKVQLEIGNQKFLTSNGNRFQKDGDIKLAIRPEKIHIFSEKPTESFSFKGKLKEKVYVGTTTKVILTLEDGQEIIANNNHIPKSNLAENEEFYLSWDTEEMVVLA